MPVIHRLTFRRPRAFARYERNAAMNHTIIESPIGPLTLVRSERGITGL